MSELTGKEVQELDLQYVLHSWSRQGAPSLPVARTEGIYFYDYDGKRYADMSSQMVCSNLGHGNPDIVRAIREQVEKMAYIAPGYASEPKSRLAKMLVDIAGGNMRKVFFTNAGAEANENAIKMARAVSGRAKIFSRYRSYHGATMGAGNASGDPRRFVLEQGGNAQGFVKFFDPYLYQERMRFESEEEATAYYLGMLRDQVIYENPYNVAAIVIETITGANGVIIPPKGYLEGVRRLCDEFGIFMICDEVMAGFGRTGKMFAYKNYDFEPDIIVFAKGVTCGYVPLGGVIVSERIANYFDDNVLQCGLTYSGHALACAAGVASVGYYLEHDVCGHVVKVGKVLADYLDRMAQKHPCVGEARHIGLFAALELVKDKEKRVPLVPYGVPNTIMPAIMGELRKRGFHTFGRENNINVCPPLIITAEELNEHLPVLDEVLSWVDEQYL